MPSSASNLDTIFSALNKEFNRHRQFDFRFYENSSLTRWEFLVKCKLDVDEGNARRLVTYKYTFILGDEYLRSRSLEEILIGLIERVRDFILCMDESDTGDYPLHRSYVDNHLSGHTRPRLGWPEQKVEGWQFHKMRGIKALDRKTPKHVVGIEKTVKYSDGYSPPPDTTETLFKKALIDRLIPVDDEGAEAMAAATKKKKVVTRNPKPLVDPSKVKKPDCPKHGTPMQFDPVRGKWKCKTDGCKITARPERDADDKSVVLGKGEITLRVVMAEGEPTVLLISSDNVALNITPLVDIKEIETAWDLETAAKAASDEGRENFVIPIEKLVTVKNIKAGVIGASDLVDFLDLI